MGQTSSTGSASPSGEGATSDGMHSEPILLFALHASRFGLLGVRDADQSMAAFDEDGKR